jgi:hypothetical protein
MISHAAVLVGLIGSGVIAGQAPEGEGWCRTHEIWLARNPGGGGLDSFGGACPIEGECDIPDVRDGFLPDETVPIRWYRLHYIAFCADDGTDCVVTEQNLIDQTASLNGDFLSWRIQFTHTFEFVNDSTYRYGDGDDTMKLLYARDPDFQCNVYVSNPDQPWSWGHFPWWPGALDWRGGVVMRGLAVQRANNVLAHEVGHNFGLYHTHHGVDEVPQCGACYERPNDPNRDVVGDFCADTPPEPENWLVCEDPETNDPCTGFPWGDTLRENHMSAAHRRCRFTFTPQQAARMHCWSEAVLLGWLDCEAGDDCNDNGVNDRCDIRDGTSDDLNGNGVPDECETQQPLPMSFNVVFGQLISGTLSDLYDSDDAHVVVQQRASLSPLLPSIRLEFEGASALEKPTILTFLLEASATALPATVTQRVELFDFDTKGWEIMDERTATLTDSVVEAVIDVDAERFVETGTGALRARASWFDPGAVFFAAWASATDQAIWTLLP